MKHRWKKYAVALGVFALFFLFTTPAPALGAVGECSCDGAAGPTKPYCQVQVCTNKGVDYYCQVSQADLIKTNQPGVCVVGFPSAINTNTIKKVDFSAPTGTTTFSSFLCNIIGFINTRILPLIAVAMTLLAGFYFMLSGQEPQKATTAKRILVYTVIGIALFLLAPGIVALLAGVLDTTGSFASCPSTTITANTVTDALIKLVNWFAWFVALTSVAMGLYAGFLYLTSRGMPQKTQQAAKTLSYVIIGVAVSILAFSIISLVKTFLK